MVFRCGRTICRECVYGLAEYHYGKAFCGISGCRCQLPPDDVPVNFSLLGILRTAPALYNYVEQNREFVDIISIVGHIPEGRILPDLCFFFFYK